MPSTTKRGIQQRNNEQPVPRGPPTKRRAEIKTNQNPNRRQNPLVLSNQEPSIHASNKSGRHLEFLMNDVIGGNIMHAAKMATKDESSADVDVAVC